MNELKGAGCAALGAIGMFFIALGGCQHVPTQQQQMLHDEAMFDDQIEHMLHEPVEVPRSMRPHPYIGDPSSGLCTNLDYAWRLPRCNGQI